MLSINCNIGASFPFILVFAVLKSMMVHWGNKWMGSSDLETSNERTTSRTAGRSLKIKQDDNKQAAKQNK